MNGFEQLADLVDRYADSATDPFTYTVGGCLLALVLIWSGAAKLRARELTALALIDFGLARRMRLGLGRALAIAELALAMALGVVAFTGGPLASATLALAACLFWAFAAVIGRSLRAGVSFPCLCFGGTEAPISRLTFLRAVALATLASVLAAAPPHTLGTSGLADAAAGVTAAVALVGAGALLGALPKLIRWNNDPWGVKRSLILRAAT